jgi:hypothetical protein
LCRKKCEEENDALIFSGLDPSVRRRPSSHGRRSRWGAQTWFGWLWDPAGESDNTPSAVFESQVRNKLITCCYYKFLFIKMSNFIIQNPNRLTTYNGKPNTELIQYSKLHKSLDLKWSMFWTPLINWTNY